MKKIAICALKRILPALIAILIAVWSVPLSLGASVHGGRCGPDLYWNLENYVLTISGTGDMYDYEPRSTQYTANEVPWKNYTTTITRVVIEEGCESIGTYAFNNFAAISELEFPETSLKTIRRSAFHNTGLKKVYLPDSVETLEPLSFSGCEKLKEISFGNGIETIPQSLCTGNTALEKIVFSPSCKTVEGSAFKDCYSLKDANLEHLERIESSAFIKCAFTEVRFGKALKYMQTNVFANCSKLTSIIFEEGTEPEEVSNLFLSGTPYYNSIPSGLYTMFDGKVQMCKGTYTKNNLVVPEGVEIISDFCFDNAKYITSVTLPSTLKTIGQFAFKDCTRLKSIDLPDGIETLCSNCIGIFTNSMGTYSEVESFEITGIGCGVVFEYAVLHNFPLKCRHKCTVVYDVEDCCAGGTKYTMCEYCGACLETAPAEPAASHRFETVAVSATCDEDGYVLEKCSVCGYEIRTGIPATGHTPAANWTVVSLPDCSKTGSVVRYCTTCGEPAETIIIEKEEHIPAEEYTAGKAATCTEPGTEVLLCTKCGAAVSERTTPPTGHVPEDSRVNVTLPAEDGTMYGCSVLKCRYCSVILEIEWLSATGETVARSAALYVNIQVMTDFLCARTAPTDVSCLDYSSDGVFNLHDILALKQMASIEDRK